MLIDTHSHLNFNAYKNDWEEVISRSLAENVWMINAGSKYETSKRAIEIAENYKEGVYAAVGLHPIHSDKEDFDKEKYKKLTKSRKVVAIGEIGLDYDREYGLFKEKQKKVFLKQLDLAKELNLPVIFHCRKAHEDLLEIFKNYQLPGVIHCFTGSWQQAKEYLEMGFYLGFNGIIYKFYPVKSAEGGVPPQAAGQFNGVNLKEVIKKIPLDRILVETDCPYLTPPQTGIERNEPIFVKYIAEEIAKIKNISFEKVAEATTQNARRLFKI